MILISILSYSNGTIVDTWRKDLVMTMVTVWGLRLFSYVIYRNWYQWRGTEDFRYKVRNFHEFFEIFLKGKIDLFYFMKEFSWNFKLIFLLGT